MQSELSKYKHSISGLATKDNDPQVKAVWDQARNFLHGTLAADSYYNLKKKYGVDTQAMIAEVALRSDEVLNQFDTATSLYSDNPQLQDVRQSLVGRLQDMQGAMKLKR